jgi:hypothetical protein
MIHGVLLGLSADVVILVIMMVMTSVPSVHEDMHQRTDKENHVRQRSKKMHFMFFP